MTTTIKYKSDLETPCLVLDMDALELNLKKMQSTVARAGKNLRPLQKKVFEGRLGPLGIPGRGVDT